MRDPSSFSPPLLLLPPLLHLLLLLLLLLLLMLLLHPAQAGAGHPPLIGFDTTVARARPLNLVAAARIHLPARRTIAAVNSPKTHPPPRGRAPSTEPAAASLASKAPTRCSDPTSEAADAGGDHEPHHRPVVPACLRPSRVGQHVDMEIATERSATTRRKDAL